MIIHDVFWPWRGPLSIWGNSMPCGDEIDLFLSLLALIVENRGSQVNRGSLCGGMRPSGPCSPGQDVAAAGLQGLSGQSQGAEGCLYEPRRCEIFSVFIPFGTRSCGFKCWVFFFFLLKLLWSMTRIQKGKVWRKYQLWWNVHHSFRRGRWQNIILRKNEIIARK